MSDFIVCPECGERIDIQNAEISNTNFFCFIKCPKCRKNLTNFHGESIAFLNAYRAVKLLWMLSAVVLTVIDLCTKYINAWHFKEGVLLCAIAVFMILGIIFLHIHDHVCKKRMKRARNGFLSFISGVCRNRSVTFAKETEISQREIDEINEHSVKSNLEMYDDTFDKVIILLPRTDMTVKMSAAAVKSLDLINLYDIYRVNNKDIFLQLSDYKAEDDIILEFKRVNNSGDYCDGFELFTLDGEYIGKVAAA